MYAQTIASPRWTTSSFADTADTSPADLSALGAHVERCHGSQGRWFAMRCVVDSLNDFVAGRIVTTLIAASALIAAIAFIF